MGEAWRARDTRLGRDVAIRVLGAEVMAEPERLGRFEREARATAAPPRPSVAARVVERVRRRCDHLLLGVDQLEDQVTLSGAEVPGRLADLLGVFMDGREISRGVIVLKGMVIAAGGFDRVWRMAGNTSPAV
jgi:hypothetical protein